MTPQRPLIFLVLFLFIVPVRAQDMDHEDFTVEGSVGAWWVRPSGHVLSNGSRADLRTDLGLSGELKGLPLGGYGHYFHTVINIGVNMKDNLTIQAGYSYLNAEVHERNNGDGFKLDFRGPVITLQFRDR